ncbi:MAG: hypothetical protein EOP00_20710 [Pedobacter sp.]|nr:MAG: hypothetical protein EOP00_20710 [Pedobacter sp.]
MKFQHFVCLILILSSCSKQKLATEIQGDFNDPNWIKLALTNEREIHAIFGSIEDTLLVSTIYNTYQITENGKKIVKLKKAFNQAVFGFVKSNDTLYALTANHLKYNNGLRFASYAQNFSLDNGLSWNWTDLRKNNADLRKKFQEVVVSDKLSFSIKENIAPFPNSPNSGKVLKSDLIKNQIGFQSIFKLPFNNQITSLHLDHSGRLYVSTTAALHNQETKEYSNSEKENLAFIFISKNKAEDLANTN